MELPNVFHRLFPSDVGKLILKIHRGPIAAKVNVAQMLGNALSNAGHCRRERRYISV